MAEKFQNNDSGLSIRTKLNSSANEFSKVPSLTRTPQIAGYNSYIKTDNTLVNYPTGAEYSEYYLTKEGETWYYTGRYGAAAVAAIVLDSSGTVIYSVENPGSLIDVTRLAIVMPANAYKVRFCSLVIALKAYQATDIYEIEELKGTGHTNETVKGNADGIADINAQLAPTIIEDQDASIDISQTMSSSVANTGTYAHPQTYNGDAEISVLKFKAGAGMSATPVTVYVYTINSSNIITKYLGFASFSATDNVISEVNASSLSENGGNPTFTLDSGDKIAIIPDVLITRFAAGSGTFLFRSGNDASKVKSVGASLFTSSPQTIVGTIGFGWVGTYDQEVPFSTSRVQNLDDNGNATTNFTVPAPTQDYSPVPYIFISGLSPYSEDVMYVGGDSMVFGQTIPHVDTWKALVAANLGMTYYNGGVNGNYLTSNLKTGGVDYFGSGIPLVDRFASEISAMPVAPKVIVFHVGTNDITSWDLDDDPGTSEFLVPLGSTGSSDPGEFLGAWNIIIDWCQTNLPESELRIITPFIRTSSLQARTVQFVDALISEAALKQVPVWDNTRYAGMNYLNSDMKTALLIDATHFNEAGHIKEARKYTYFVLTGR